MGEDSQKLATYIKGLTGFTYREQMEPRNHMGATLTDVMFQAGINWHTSVEPRINKIKSYERAATIDGLKSLFSKLNAEEFFNWKGRKPRNFLNIIDFLDKEYVDTENDLKRWLMLPGSTEKLMKQPGFGNKTVDYIKMLVGFPNVAVDRHIVTMLERAGIFIDDYEEAKTIVIGAAKILNVNPSVLDHSIWYYISGSKD
jgi:endonuclease III-like uncharacterized protein